MDPTKTPSKEAAARTEADARSMDGQSARSNESSKSSHDKSQDKSHMKAGSQTGAGGGKKQERHH